MNSNTIDKNHESFPSEHAIKAARPIARGTINKHLRKRQLDIVAEIASLQAEYEEINKCVEVVTDKFR